MYPQITTALRCDERYVQVQNAAHLDHLIKESEVLTGRKGRQFCLRWAHRRVRIALELDGYEVCHLESSRARSIYVTRPMLSDCLLGFNLRYGILFTRVLTREAVVAPGGRHGQGGI